MAIGIAACENNIMAKLQHTSGCGESRSALLCA